MEGIEDYFNNGLDFFQALSYLESLDYDSDHYWYSGSEEYYGSDSFSSGDNSEWLDNDGLRLLGNILNNQINYWRPHQFEAENDCFPVTLKTFSESAQVFPSLIDLSAKVVSQHLPYSYIQRKHNEIPERVSKKIMLWSFPRHLADIYRYWLNPLFMCKGISGSQFKNGCYVEKMDQFGFCVQGQVTFLEETHTASLLCDRCTIITTSCSCRNEGILWCRHVVALAICRICHVNNIEVHLPIFGSISKLNRDQLQKLLQYLICDGHLSALESLQDEVSRITMSQSLIGEIEDITAPVIYEGKPKWFLEPVNCKDISFPAFMLLVQKALKMSKVKDANGMHILRNLLLNIPIRHYKSIGPMNKITTALISVISSPVLSDDEKKECYVILKDQQYNHITSELYDDNSSDSFASLWRNNVNYISCKRTKLSSAAEEARYSIFYMPLASIDLGWDDKYLRKILRSDFTLSHVDNQGLHWFEHFPTSCARIEVLFNNGYEIESVRLAVVIAKSIVLQIKKWKQAWINILLDGTVSQTKQKVQQLMTSAGESWLNQTMILHKIDPADILFSSLANAPQVLKIISKENAFIDENEYLQLAIEAIFVILSQQLFPKNKQNPNQYQLREKEATWLSSILSIVSRYSTSDSSDDEVLIATKWKPNASRIQDLFKQLADAGPFTVLGSAGDYFIPRYQWGYMMITILIHIDKNLAIEVGWKCLKYPLNKIVDSYYEEQYISDHMKLIICILALHDGDGETIDKILDAADYLKNTCKAIHFLTEFKAFITEQQFIYQEITTFTKKNIFNRVLKSLKSGKKTHAENSGVCVTSLLRFAATIGYDTVIEFLKNWNDFFDISHSIEILNHCDWAENISDSHQKNQTQLANVIYNLVLQCTENKIDNHMFNAMLAVQRNFHFSETQKKLLNDKIFAFGISCSTIDMQQDVLYSTLSRLADDATKVTAFKNFVSDAIKKNKITPQKLFVYSQQEQENDKRSAFNLGILAVQHISILPNCQYGGIKVNFETNCIVSIFRLAIDLGESEIAEIIHLVINNVKHNAVLCDLTKTFHAIVIEKSTKKPEWLEKFIIDVMGILQQSIFRRIKRLRNEVNFINNLKRTMNIYLLANDGWSHFLSLISNLKPLLPLSKRKWILKSIGIQG